MSQHFQEPVRQLLQELMENSESEIMMGHAGNRKPVFY